MKKQEIRKRYKVLRSRLTQEAQLFYSKSILDQFKNLVLPDIHLLHHYIAVPEQNEISVDGVIS